MSQNPQQQTSRKWVRMLDHWMHNYRDWLNDVLKFGPVRRELVRSVGWERALIWGLSDWFEGVPADTAQNPDFIRQLAEIFQKHPKAVRTQVGTLSMLLQRANAAAHDHGGGNHDCSDHEAPRRLALQLVKALQQSRPDVLPVREMHKKSTLNLSTFSLLGKDIPSENPDDSRILAALEMLTRQYKDPYAFVQKHLAEAAVRPRQSFLKSLWFNGVAAAVISATGFFGISSRIQSLAHFRKSPEPEQVRAHPASHQQEPSPFEAAEQGSLFIGAYFLGVYLSMDARRKKLSAEDEKAKHTAMLGHIATEFGLTAASAFSIGLEHAGALVDGLVIKQATDSMMDNVATQFAVHTAHNLIDQVNADHRINDSLRDHLSGALSTLAAVGAHDALEVLQTVLLPVYAGAYAGYWGMKACNTVRAHHEKKHLEHSENHKKSWLYRCGAAVAGGFVALGATCAVVWRQMPQGMVATPNSNPAPQVRVAPQKTVPLETAPQTAAATRNATAFSAVAFARDFNSAAAYSKVTTNSDGLLQITCTPFRTGVAKGHCVAPNQTDLSPQMLAEIETAVRAVLTKTNHTIRITGLADGQPVLRSYTSWPIENQVAAQRAEWLRNRLIENLKLSSEQAARLQIFTNPDAKVRGVEVQSLLSVSAMQQEAAFSR